MSRARKTTAAPKRLTASRIAALAKRAGRLANQNRKIGYHGSDSVFAKKA